MDKLSIQFKMLLMSSIVSASNTERLYKRLALESKLLKSELEDKPYKVSLLRSVGVDLVSFLTLIRTRTKRSWTSSKRSKI